MPMDILHPGETRTPGAPKTRRHRVGRLTPIAVAALAIMILAPTPALLAAPSNVLKVKPTADVRGVTEGMNNIFEKIMLPCLIRTSNKLKAKGVEISGPMREKIEKQCLCEEKAAMQPRFKRVTDIVARHPEWKGKTLEVQMKTSDGMEQEDIPVEHIMVIQSILARCP